MFTDTGNSYVIWTAFDTVTNNKRNREVYLLFITAWNAVQVIKMKVNETYKQCSVFPVNFPVPCAFKHVDSLMVNRVSVVSLKQIPIWTGYWDLEVECRGLAR